MAYAFYIISILYTQLIINYSLHHSFAKRISYITFALSITFVLHGQPTFFYIIFILYTQPILNYSLHYYLTKRTGYNKFPSTLPSFCMDSQFFYTVLILYAQSILNYSLRYCLTKRTAYNTSTLRLNAILRVQPTFLSA